MAQSPTCPELHPKGAWAEEQTRGKCARPQSSGEQGQEVRGRPH